MPELAGSTAIVSTDRPQRYGKQLVSHMTRKVPGTWDEAGTGEIAFEFGTATLTSVDGALRIEVAGDPENLERLESVIGRHLVRFGTRDELVVSWVRSDGTPGTEQRNDGD